MEYSKELSELKKAQAIELLNRAEELLKEAKELSHPKEPNCEYASPPPVIQFQKDFGGESPVYNYAAIAVQPAGGRTAPRQHWYVTGAVHGKRRWLWEELLEFIGEDYWDTIVVLSANTKEGN